MAKIIDYVARIYKLTSRFPINERFGLTDQLRRASVSITLNIAEGCGAGSKLEFIRFLKMAQRSAYEVMAALERLAIRLGRQMPTIKLDGGFWPWTGFRPRERDIKVNSTAGHFVTYPVFIRALGTIVEV